MVRRLTLTYHLLTSLTAVLCIQLKNKKNNKTKQKSVHFTCSGKYQ